MKFWLASIGPPQDPVIESLKRFKEGIGRALGKGWSELFNRSSGALTRFDDSPPDRGKGSPRNDFPQWSLLAGETWETAKAVIVRIEAPGVRKEDLDVSILDDAVVLRGIKHSGDGPAGSRQYGLMQRAFGSFQRSVALTHDVDRKHPEVSYQDGVVTVILQKTHPAPPQTQSRPGDAKPT